MDSDSDNTFPEDDETARSLSEKSEKNIAWVEELYSRWINVQREKSPNFFPIDLANLLKNFRPIINEYLPKFFNEIRKKDGEMYPPNTLLVIMRTIQMLVYKLNLGYSLWVDDEFAVTRKHLKNAMRKSTQSGYQRPKRKFEIVTDQMEKELWQKGFLGVTDPQTLLRTVYFFIVKFFGLRARMEHRGLRYGFRSQIQVVGEGSAEKIIYKGDVSRNNGGRIKYSPKKIQVSRTGAANCPVAIIKLYISLVDPKAKTFYCQPVMRKTQSKWFSQQPVGKNKISGFMKELAGLAKWDLTRHWGAVSLQTKTVSLLFEKRFQLFEIDEIAEYDSESEMIGPSSSNDLYDHQEFESQLIQIEDAEKQKREGVIQANG